MGGGARALPLRALWREAAAYPQRVARAGAQSRQGARGRRDRPLVRARSLLPRSSSLPLLAAVESTADHADLVAAAAGDAVGGGSLQPLPVARGGRAGHFVCRDAGGARIHIRRSA